MRTMHIVAVAPIFSDIQPPTSLLTNPSAATTVTVAAASSEVKPSACIAGIMFARIMLYVQKAQAMPPTTR